MKYENIPTNTDPVPNLIDRVNGLVELHISHGFE